MDRPLYAYTYADVAYDDAIALLAEDPEGVLQSATEASVEHADDVVARLELGVGGFEVGRDVVVHLGTFDPVEQLRGVLPLHWEAAQGHVLFPTVDATLEVAAMSLHPPMVQVTLTGNYHPPMGLVGRAIDRVAHRAAEAVIHRFVRDVAERLEALASHAVAVRLEDVALQPREPAG